MQFQYSVSVPNSAAEPPLYASREGIALFLGGDECVFRLRDGGGNHVMTTDVLQAVALTRQFRPLAEHAAAIAAQLPALQGRSDVVLRVLENLVQRGILVSDATLRAELTRAVPAREPAPPGAAWIRACDRPTELARLLASLEASRAAHGAVPPVRVIDDSRHAAAADANRRVLADAAARGLDVRHLADAEIEDLLARLERALPAHRAAIRFLFGRSPERARFGGGRALNLALLLGAGTRAALLDEDFVLPLHRHPAARAGLLPAGSTELAVRVLPDLEAALAAGVPDAAEPFAAAARWCGQSLSAVLGATPELAITRESLAGVDIGSLRRIRADGRIAAVQHGHRGQAGAAGNTFLFLLDRDGRQTLWASREAYLRALDDRCVYAGVPQYTLVPQAAFTPFMVDGGALLPPTMPYGRCEDSLFNQLLPAIRADALILQTPFAIGHVPEPGRRPLAGLRDPDQPDLNTFLADYVVGRIETLRAQDPARRLRAIAEHYADLAAAPAADREALLGEYLAHRRADLIQRLQAVFQEAGAESPVYWQADVRLKIEVNGRALTAEEPPRLHGWPADWDGRRCADELARELQAWSQALMAWPALWTHALEARAGGGLGG